MRIKSQYVKEQLAKIGEGFETPRQALVTRQRKPRETKLADDPAAHLAGLYVKHMRRGESRDATWFDVRDAYIEGYKAAEVTRAAQRR